MSLKEDIRPVTYLKSKAADLLTQINRTGRPVVITQNGKPRGVLLDTESYERIRSAIGILKLVNQSEVAIRSGKHLDQSTVFDNLEKKLTTLKAKQNAKKV